MGLKLQCGCGQKVELDVSAETASQPIQFICPTCGADNSAVATQVVRQMFGLPQTIAPPPAPHPPPRVQVPPAVTTPSSKVKVHLAAHAAPSSPAPSTPQAIPTPVQPAAAQRCLKHHGQPIVNYCMVCQKPLCPSCMEIFGYVCSAYCRNKAESEKMDIPVYENLRTVVDAKVGKNVVRYTLAVAAAITLLVGVWAWWEWIATSPRPIFSVNFKEKGYSGQARMNGQNQTVALHGGTLARYDLKSKKEVWSQYLLDKKQIADAAAVALEKMKESRNTAVSNGADPDDWRIPTVQDLTEEMVRSAESSLQLHALDQNVWIQFPTKLVRYDWQNGNSLKEITLTEFYGHWRAHGSELVSSSENESGERVITRLDLASGDLRKEQIAFPRPVVTLAKNATRPSLEKSRAALPVKLTSNQMVMAARLMTNKAFLANLGKAGNKPLDPKAVAQQYQNMPLSSKVALPAVLAANANQQRLLAELKGDTDETPNFNLALAAAKSAEPIEHSSFIEAGDGFVELSVKLLEHKTIERKVMKAPPKKSVLDGELSTGNSMTAANELLNEMQREKFGDSVQEDVSHYQVKLRKIGGSGEEWSGEVTGEPQFFATKSLNILVASDSLYALDKNNKKLWDGKISSRVVGGHSEWEDDRSSNLGEGPCVERGDRLYLFDQAVLSCYEKSTGKVAWRLPAVGIAGLFFDDRGSVYVNATTASPDSLKYSMQIDVTQKTRSQIIKVQEASGKVLWRQEGEGMLRYLSGKFIYTIDTYAGDLADESSSTRVIPDIKTGLETPPHVQIKRISPKTGRVLWEHYQKRYPLDVQFDQNRIQLLFRRELQVLKFMTL